MHAKGGDPALLDEFRARISVASPTSAAPGTSPTPSSSP